MPTLILRLAAPLQAWGAAEEGEFRRVNPYPTRSGIMGMIANAAGHLRGDAPGPWEGLRIGVRVDRAGTLIRDYHTAHRASASAPSLSRRMYLSDAVFLVGLEGDAEVLDAVIGVLSAPKRPLFLGRKGCPPSVPVLGDILTATLEDALNEHPWLPSEIALTGDQKARAKRVTDKGDLVLDTFVEPTSYVAGAATVRDVPVSRVSNDRRFLSRQVVAGKVVLPCTSTVVPRSVDKPIPHDPFDF